MKKFYQYILTLIVCFLPTFSIYAYNYEYDENLFNSNPVPYKVIEDNSCLSINYELYDSERHTPNTITRAVNRRWHREWSQFDRVSNNILTGSNGGSITSTNSTTFNTQVSGSISGLGISTSTSVSSSLGYTLNVGPNRRVYMGFRVRYEVETGTREIVCMHTGRVLSSNSYTVRVPLYGEFALINA